MSAITSTYRGGFDCFVVCIVAAVNRSGFVSCTNMESPEYLEAVVELFRYLPPENLNGNVELVKKLVDNPKEASFISELIDVPLIVVTGESRDFLASPYNKTGDDLYR